MRNRLASIGVVVALAVVAFVFSSASSWAQSRQIVPGDVGIQVPFTANHLLIGGGVGNSQVLDSSNAAGALSVLPGNLQITGLASAGNQCVHASSTGVLSVTGSDCGSGGSTITAGSTATSGFTSGNLMATAGSLATDSGIAVSAVATLTGTQTLTNKTLVTPALGTPASGTLTHATGLPISTGVGGLGTGVATALAVNTGSAGSVALNAGSLTPGDGVVVNSGSNGVQDSSAVSTAAFPSGLSVSKSVAFGAGANSGPTVSPLWATFTATGIATDSVTTNFSLWQQTQDNVDASAASNGVFNWEVVAVCCGSSAKGGRQLGTFFLNVNGVPADTKQNYTALQSAAQASVNVGGLTGTGNGRGNIFGGNDRSILVSGGTFWHSVIGREIDTGIATGASAELAAGLNIVQSGNSAVAASIADTAITVGNGVSGLPGRDYLFTDGSYDGFPALKTGGTVFACYPHANNNSTNPCGAIGSFADLSNFSSLSGNIILGPGSNGKIDGSFNILAADVTASAAGAASKPGLLVSGAPFTGGSGTTTQPQLYISANGATAPTTFSTNGTLLGGNAPSGFTGNFLDFVLNGSSVHALTVDNFGDTTISGSMIVGQTNIISFNARGVLSSPGSGQIRFGNTDAATVVAQALSVQGAAAGQSNLAGQNWTFAASKSTGTGVGGDIIFQTAGTGAATTAQNSETNALVIKGATQSVQLPAAVTGTPTASLCLDASNNIIKKTTTGACI